MKHSAPRNGSSIDFLNNKSIHSNKNNIAVINGPTPKETCIRLEETLKNLSES